MGRTGPWRHGVLDVQAHAGAQGHVVGNTWPAFALAAELGARNVELDVRVTRDGVPVVWHDMVIHPKNVLARDRKVYGRRIDELSYAELSVLETGTVTQPEHRDQRPVTGVGILRLVDLFTGLSRICPTMWFTVEVKLDCTDPRQIGRRRQTLDAVLAAIDAAAVRDRAILHSFDWTLLDEARERAPYLLRSALVAANENWWAESPFLPKRTFEDNGGDPVISAYRLGVDAIAPRFRTLSGIATVDATFVSRAHALGLAVNPWTVDTARDHTLLLRAGVDGIVTNYPERLVGTTTPRW